MVSTREDISLGAYMLQATSLSGAQLHIYRRGNAIKHKHAGYLAEDERTAYEEALMWVVEHADDGLQRAIAILERMGFEVVLVS